MIMNGESPFHQPEPIPTPPENGGNKVADPALRVVMLLVSLVSLGIAMLSVAFVAVQFLVFHNQRMRENIWSVIITIALAYLIGWIVALVGIRYFHNLVLPVAINLYAWATLAGISVLYIAILYRLYEQAYYMTSFAKYIVLMWAAVVGFVGLHLLIENHDLRPFSIPLIIIALIHLYLIVYHYVFASDVNYDYLFGDVLFFLGMTLTSVLMLLHTGMLSGVRKRIDRIFEPKPNGNTQPQNQQ